jgi:hypothetical protein
VSPSIPTVPTRNVVPVPFNPITPAGFGQFIPPAWQAISHGPSSLTLFVPSQDCLIADETDHMYPIRGLLDGNS